MKLHKINKYIQSLRKYVLIILMIKFYGFLTLRHHAFATAFPFMLFSFWRLLLGVDLFLVEVLEVCWLKSLTLFCWFCILISTVSIVVFTLKSWSPCWWSNVTHRLKYSCESMTLNLPCICGHWGCCLVCLLENSKILIMLDNIVREFILFTYILVVC